MTGFAVNPPRAAIVDAQGKVTPEWYRYFVALQKIVGGPSDPFEDTSFLSGLPMPSSALMPPDDALAPPQRVVEVPDPLTPPVIAPQFDDLMYPPRYGA